MVDSGYMSPMDGGMSLILGLTLGHTGRRGWTALLGFHPCPGSLCWSGCPHRGCPVAFILAHYGSAVALFFGHYAGAAPCVIDFHYGGVMFPMYTLSSHSSSSSPPPPLAPPPCCLTPPPSRPLLVASPLLHLAPAPRCRHFRLPGRCVTLQICPSSTSFPSSFLLSGSP